MRRYVVIYTREMRTMENMSIKYHKKTELGKYLACEVNSSENSKYTWSGLFAVAPESATRTQKSPAINLICDRMKKRIGTIQR